jgi:hypothetical protein
MGALETLEVIQNAESFWGLDSSDCHGAGKFRYSPATRRNPSERKPKDGYYLEWRTEEGNNLWVRYVTYKNGVEVARSR